MSYLRQSRKTSKVLHQAAQRRALFAMESLDPRTLFTGSIQVTVTNDVNFSDTVDASDTPLSGWTVFLDINRDGAFQSGELQTTTNGSGIAVFSGLATNTFDVVEVLQSGWVPAPSFKVLDRASVKDGRTTNIQFLNQHGAGTITGTIWSDTNGDGVRDSGDPGLAGWTTYIDANDNRVLDAGEVTATTNASGVYTIPNLDPGTYIVREVVQSGWSLTLGFDGRNRVTVTPGGTVTSDFGNFNGGALGNIRGTIWNDVNADGFRAAGDAGLGGWTVFLDLNSNSILDAGETSATTDALGAYSIPSVFQGTYRVMEIQPSGWNISPGFAVARTAVVTPENTTVIDFANWTPTLGSISGNVWSDANGNGAIDAGEAGVAGWTIFIDQDSDGALGATEPSATTDAGGNYTLGSVAIGSSVVREIAPIGWRPTAPGTGMQLVNVPNGTAVTNIIFGNQQRTDSSISGTVYIDANKNGVRDAGERGFAGVTVFFDLNDNGVADPGEPSTVSSADLFYTPDVNEAGAYTFTHLSAGSYVVREAPPVEQSATPLGSRKVNVNLLAGEDRIVNFGNVFRENEIHGFKYNDLNGNHDRDAGEPGMGGVTIYLDLDRNNVMDALEPRTLTASDGSYGFTTGLARGSYVVREYMPHGYTHTYPQTTGGTLFPPGVSHAAIGNVTPTSITTVLSQGQTYSQAVSLTLPPVGALTNMADVFLLFDDTGSFTGNSPIVRAAFPTIISSLQTALPGLDLGFGVGRFEEYANYASELSTGRPFILNQPVVSQTTTGFSTAIQNALDRTAPGYGGDTPETDFEALFQTVTGRGFDGNNNGTTTDSGAAGLASTQLNPGASGDVPAFSSYVADTAAGGLAPSGSTGGAGFRPGALPIILLATDTGFAYQPRGETSITGLNGTTLPISALTQTSRPTTPFNSGAGIQETITALNALGALVIGLGTNPGATLDPRQGLEAISKLTGATNQSLTTIPNGTADPIAPGDPLYFQIASGFGASVANGVVSAIENAVSNVAVNITLKSSDPRVQITSDPNVVNNIGAGETANFNVTFTGDGRPHRFDLQFVRQGTDVVLGSIPVVIGTPITGDGYEYEDLDEGQIDNHVDFGNQVDALATPISISSRFDYASKQALVVDFSGDVGPDITLSDFAVTKLGTGESIALQNMDYDPVAHRATITFASKLNDGDYVMTLAAGSVTTQTTSHSLSFFVMNGDADHNRKVDTQDFNFLAGHFGGPGLFADGDFDYSGNVDSVDFDLLLSSYGNKM